MIQYTLENTIILYVFQTLLAGLIFLVAVWESLRRPPKPDCVPLAAAFFFFSGFVLLRSLFSISLSSDRNLLSSPWPFLLLSALETLFLGCLMVWLAPSGAWKKALAAISVLLAVTQFVSRSLFREATSTFEPFYHGGFLHLALALALVFLAGRSFPQRWNLIKVGLIFFAGSYLAESIFDLYVPWPAVLLWNCQYLCKILGLLSFALYLEKEGSNMYVQFFLRLNLIFILAANTFMLLLSETERRNYLSFSAAQVQDLAEFLRGHVVYFYRGGLHPAEIVERDEINHRIVSEFGRIPALKRVRMEVAGHQMWMSIDREGLISYQSGRELFQRSQSIYDYEGKTITVLQVPVTLQSRPIGLLLFDEDLLSLSRKIAGQMQLIFLSFTAVVLVTLGALGFIVLRAQRTIQRQYSALEEKREELIRASRLASIGELVDGVAHEVNNPTGVILIRSECALAALPQSGLASVRDDLEEIRRQSERMTKLVRNLLAFSRATPLKMVPIDLNQIVRRSLDLVSAYLKITGVRVEVALQPDLPAVRGDADRLEQVVVNLVKNAADVMPQGGTLSCRTWKNGAFASLSVADTGTGIAPEILDQIFNPFFTTKAPGSGTGLGLSISDGIIRDHGGQIEVQSEPGRGSEFTVHLPFAVR